LGLLAIISLLYLQGCGNAPALRPWHTVTLTEEFTAEMVGVKVRSFEDYLALETRLFKQLDE
jgi:hypothetical protein